MKKMIKKGIRLRSNSHPQHTYQKDINQLRWTFVDGPDTPDGWVKIIYWDKAVAEIHSMALARMLSMLYMVDLDISYLHDKKGPVPKGMNDEAVGGWMGEALAEYQERKNSIRAPMQEVRLNGYRARWEPFMGISGMGIARCPGFEGKTVNDTLIDDADNVTCTYDDGTVAEGYMVYTGEDKQAGMITYWHEYELGIAVIGGLPLEELA